MFQKNIVEFSQNEKPKNWRVSTLDELITITSSIIKQVYSINEFIYLNPLVDNIKDFIKTTD